jgi:hypothetical protein
MILTLPALTMLTTMAYLLTMLWTLVRRKLAGHDRQHGRMRVCVSRDKDSYVENNLYVTRRCTRSIKALYSTISTVLSTHTPSPIPPPVYIIQSHMQVI